MRIQFNINLNVIFGFDDTNHKVKRYKKKTKIFTFIILIFYYLTQFK